MCLWRVAAAIWTFLIWIFLLGASIALSTLFLLTYTLLLSIFQFSLLPANFVFGGQDKEPNHALATVSSQTALCLCHCLPAKKYAAPCERVCNHIHNNNHHHHTHRQTRTRTLLTPSSSWFMRCWQLSKFNYKAALWGAQNERKIDKQWKLNCTFCSASQGLAAFACWQPARGSVTCGGTWVCVRVWWLHLRLLVPPRTNFKKLVNKINKVSTTPRWEFPPQWAVHSKERSKVGNGITTKASVK